MEIKGKVSQIETFGLADGPGVRFVIFLQGCSMRCMYCHNPETWSFNRKVTEYTADELIKKELRYKSYQKDNGGITVSGGEPLQQIDFVIELFEKAHENDIHTALDTALQPFTKELEFLEKFDKLLEVTDLVILDIKAMDEELHKKVTGHTNINILEGAKYISQKNVPLWIRHVLVPNLTDSTEELTKIKEFVNSLKTVEKCEILPYHTLGISKWENLGIEYQLKDTKIPTEEEILKAERLFIQNV